MFHRQTQTEDYWVRDFSVTPDDLDFVNNLLLEREKPLPAKDLTVALMRNRVEQEGAKLARMLSKGTIYKPLNDYPLGETLVFPALNFSTGRVTKTRPGHNPEHGEFQVIEVQFDRSGRKREFAAGLSQPHPLDEQTDNLLREDASLRTIEELFKRYGKAVEKNLSAAMEQQGDLVHLFGLWFLKALVSEIGPGYLNIAEAILDIAGGGPMPTASLLNDLGLPERSRPELLEFSLDYALYNDSRFDEVGPAGKVLWYLHNMEPKDVLFPPKRLVYTPIAYDHDLLNLNLRKLEQNLDDEWSSGWKSADEPGRVTCILTFPHRRQGTVPLSSQIAPLFPTSYQTPRIRCVFVDGHSGAEMEGWVVWEGRFVHGLKGWYEKYNLMVGAFLHLSPGPEPGKIVIEYDMRRPQQEWVRVAQADQGQLVFGMQKRSISWEYDDMMMIGMDNLEAADEVWAKFEEERPSLAQIMVRIFPELAKLSPQNTVHAKTLYSAVNLVRRCPPGPIFAELVRQPCFISMGENYWRFNPSLWGRG